MAPLRKTSLGLTPSKRRKLEKQFFEEVRALRRLAAEAALRAPLTLEAADFFVSQLQDLMEGRYANLFNMIPGPSPAGRPRKAKGYVPIATRKRTGRPQRFTPESDRLLLDHVARMRDKLREKGQPDSDVNALRHLLFHHVYRRHLEKGHTEPYAKHLAKEAAAGTPLRRLQDRLARLRTRTRRTPRLKDE